MIFNKLFICKALKRQNDEVAEKSFSIQNFCIDVDIIFAIAFNITT